MLNKLLKSLFSLTLISLIAISFAACDDDGGGTAGGGEDYYITATIDGTETTFDGGFTAAGSVPIASYDGDDDATTIQAYDPSIANFASANGLMITDFDGNAVGTCTTCSAIYYINGAMNAATNLTVTIDSYGATGGVVSGSLTDCTINGHTFVDCTFSVRNLGAE